MSEQDPFGEDTRMWQESDASDFAVWESLEGLKEMINAVLASSPRSSLTPDEFYCVSFDLLDEQDGMVALAGYNYEGEFVELVEDEDDPHVVLKDVCCHVLPDGSKYEPKDREAYFRDTVFIARHTLMRVPLSKFSNFLMSIRSKSETKAEYAKYGSPVDLF